MSEKAKKRCTIAATVCLVLLLLVCMLVACTPKPNTETDEDAVESYVGTYYAFTNGVKDANDWIRLRQGERWDDSDGLSGRLSVSGDLILLYYGEDVLWHGSVQGNAFIWTSGDIGVAGEQWRKYYLDDGQNAGKDSTPYVDNTPGGPFGNGQTSEGGSGNGSGSGGSGQTPVTYYTVQFNPMNGTSAFSVQVRAGNTLTPPATPDRSGYRFLGWYTQITGGEAWDFATDTVSQSFTLYARWETEVRPDEDPPEEGEGSIDKTAVVSDMADGLADVFNVLASGTKEDPGGRGIDVTLSLGLSANQPDGAPLHKDAKVHLAVTTSASAAQNKILVEFLMGEDPYLSLYLDGADHAYLGEALTQDGQQWFKVAGMGIQKLVANYFPYFAGVLADDELLQKQDVSGKKAGLEEVARYISEMRLILAGLFGEISETDVGEYTRYDMPIDVSVIGPVIPTLVSVFGGNMNGGESKVEAFKRELDGLYPGLGGMMDPISSILFGGSLEALLNGTLSPEQAPDLRIEAGMTDEGALKEFGIRYAARTLTIGGLSLSNVNLHVALENMTVSTNAGLDIVPERVEQGVQAADELAIKASVNIALPQKEKALGLDFYFVPDIRIDWGEASEDYPQGRFLGLDMSGTKAYVVGTVDGVPAASLGAELVLGPWRGGSTGDQKGVLYVDIAGLYALAGITDLQGRNTKYKVEFFYGGAPEPELEEYGLQNAGAPRAGNVIDNLVFGITDIFSYDSHVSDIPMNFLALIANNIGDAVNALKGLANDIAATVDTRTDGQITLDFGAILSVICNNTTLRGASSLGLDILMHLFSPDVAWLERFYGHDDNLLSYFTSVERIVEFINILNNSPESGLVAADVLNLANLVAECIGLKGTEGEHYFRDVAALNKLLAAGGIKLTIAYHRNATNGLGYQATLAINGTPVLKTGVSVDVVTADHLPDSYINPADVAWQDAFIGDSVSIWQKLVQEDLFRILNEYIRNCTNW